MKNSESPSFNPEQKIEQEPSPVEIRQIQNDDEIAQMWQLHRRVYNECADDEKEEQNQVKVLVENTKNVLEAKDGTYVLVGAFEEGGDLIGWGRLSCDLQKKEAFLSYEVVDEKFRMKGVSKQITETRLEFAKALGCEIAKAHISLDKPAAIRSIFSSGFVFTYPFTDSLVIAEKELVPTKNEDSIAQSTQMVPLHDKKEIMNLLNKGGKGVSLTMGDGANWHLHLEK